MGWGNILFDSELMQRLDIEQTKRRLQTQAFVNARSRGRLRKGVEALEDDVGTIALACRTMMRLLIEKNVFTRDEFVAAMKAIDAQDGKADGRYTGPVDAP